MSNSGLLITEKENLCIYLHWNGAYNSVVPFLEYCRLQGVCSPEHDDYGWARLCQVIGNFFGGTTSIGISEYKKQRTDNGTFVIKDWGVVGCETSSYNAEKLKKFLLAIDAEQPPKMQIKNRILSTMVDTKNLKIGDTVLIKEYEKGYTEHKIVGFGVDTIVNGVKVYGMPFVNRWNTTTPETNINNYLQEEQTPLVVKDEIEEV